METFGDWLQSELNNRNMSQADLARSSGLKTATISRIANGRREPGIKALKAIARGLPAPEIEVFHAANAVRPLTSSEAERKEIIAAKFAELTLDEQDDVLEYIEFIHQRRRQPQPSTPQRQRQGSRPGEVVK